MKSLRRFAPAVACIVALACTDPKPPAPSTSGTSSADASTADADSQVALDVASIDVAAACPGGGGCACSQNSECESGFCLDTQAGKVCAQKCIDACPQKFTCSQVPAPGGDLVSICVEKYGHLCDPCTASSQCVVAGQADPRCVHYGKLGAFCGSACAADSDCAEGFACKKVPTIEGTAAQQCVRKASVGDGFGVCPCSTRAVALSLTTACKVEHKDGTGTVIGACDGQRACLTVGADGLAACEAPDASPELCDGKDNDCDGVTDEATCDDSKACTADSCAPGAPVAGKDGCVHSPQPGQACEDGNPCSTGDTCDGVGTCKAGNDICECTATSGCAAKEDGDACNGTLVCDVSSLPYTCKVDPATVVACDPAKDTACAINACDKVSGKCALLPKPASTTCDDGDTCTAGDNCQNGACTAGTTICQCQSNADCAGQEDGNLCNGTLYCDKGVFPYLCKVNPATLVVCNAANDTACQKSTCEPNTGKCGVAPAENGTACDADNNKCTVGDACNAGVCEKGENLCDCTANVDCQSKEDGDPCNGILFCNKAKGKCEVNPQTVVNCPTGDNTACAASQCDKKTGACKMGPLPEQAPCNDGNLCTSGDACQSGICAGSANTCICQSDADCTGKDDGDLCNGTLFCDKAKGTCQLNPATVVTCPSVNDTACTVNQCDKKSGKCLMTATSKTCDDGNPCTLGDVCGNGLCQPGTNGCSCKVDGDCAAKEDGNLCNGTLFCNKALGACQVNPATLIACSDTFDSTCQHSVCQPGSGKCAMVPRNQGNPCDDGDVCSQGEFCQLGLCSGGVNACPCQSDQQCVAKDDGNWCNGTLYCDKSLPVFGCVFNPKSVVVCPADDDTACLKNQCNTATGKCSKAGVQGACDDGEPCTVGDFCSSGACLAGKNTCPCLTAADCDDNVKCTLDSCDKAKGCGHGAIDGLCDDGQVCTADSCDVASDCKHANIAATCSDDNVCTQTDTCSQGKCAGTKPMLCGDGNACTDDACDKQKGCTATANTATCSDGSVCTVGDICVAGACQSGPPADCSDGDACTQDNCDVVKGCGWPAAVCDDKLPCTADSCAKQSGCTFLPQDASCVDANPCSDDVCDKAKGCLHLANGATCSDGDACTSGDNCADKACATSGKTDCNDSNVCTFDTCDTIAGCVNQVIPNAIACDDGSACTIGDSCVGGKCLSGSPKVCGDGNPCSTGGCDAKTGCVSTPVANGAPCSDGDACTVGDGCGNANCLPGAVTSCDDSNVCTIDSCDKASGCKYAANTLACSDGNACTSGDVCASGGCKGGATVLNCDDGNKCTNDSCDKVKGCVAPLVADGTECGGGATCKAGVCVGAGKALMVGAGGHHTCVLTAINTVMCWGRNHVGQLGDGTLIDRYNPTPVALPGEVSSIAIGGDFSCALLKSGAVYCWGDNTNGQLGDGSANAAKLPVQVTGLSSGVKAVAAGAFHACAITAAGAAKCWGLNNSSQLGNGSTVNAKVPAQVSVLDATVTAIAAGGAHTCAIAFDGLTLCWGSNASGQLGNGTTNTKTEPELVPGLAAPAQSLDAGAAHTCAVKADGSLWCWGQAGAANGYNKQLANSSVPVKINSGVAQVSAALSNTCTLLANGKIYCRGYDGNGEIGNALFDAADAGYADTLVPLNGLAKFVATGGNHSCAVLNSGELQCWGYNLYGQIGLGQPSYIATPKAVVGLPAKVKAAATGGNHTCASVDGGGVYCWGLNNSLQVGQPKGQAYSKPMLVGSVGGGSTVAKQISAGANHTCAVMTDGGVSCWGDNSKSQLGAPAKPVGPVGVTGLGGPASAVAAGAAHSCALVGGGIQCWGDDMAGQLGNGTLAGGVVPTSTVGISSAATSVATGFVHTCAVVAGGVLCWGTNGSGQMGVTTGAAQVPLSAAGLSSGVTAVVAGAAHTCAVLSNGSVKCWGLNTVGQLGDNASINVSPVAVQPIGLSNGVLAVAAGTSHTCALLKTGAVQCWGLNDSGQLGDFSTTNKSVPTQVFGMTSGAIAIAAGGNTTCALMVTGAIKCWGANTYGQLGNGDTVKKNVPTLGPSLPNVTALAVGGNHACAIADGGKIYCWGAGALYQMGDGTAVAANTAARALGIGGAGELAAGRLFSDTLLLGSVLHWGWGFAKSVFSGCLGYNFNGNGPQYSQNYSCWVPDGLGTAVNTSITGAVALAAGAEFECALMQSGSIQCRGDNGYGQLGAPYFFPVGGQATEYKDYSNGQSIFFSPVESWKTVQVGAAKAIAAGGSHACALASNGGVNCWGRGTEGQLGSGSTPSTSLPAGVVGLLPSKALAAGGNHTCAVLEAGAVNCWGSNASGQVGDASIGAHPKPFAIPDLKSGVATLAAGSAHTCALLSTGAVKCWGDGLSGKLGVGTLANSNKPLDVPALGTDVATLVAGSTANHTCAILKDGTLKCWGENLYGQIGDGVPITSSPAYVGGFGP